LDKRLENILWIKIIIEELKSGHTFVAEKLFTVVHTLSPPESKIYQAAGEFILLSNLLTLVNNLTVTFNSHNSKLTANEKNAITRIGYAIALCACSCPKPDYFR
jgi:hypothetical protein